MTENELRKNVVETAMKYLGIREGSEAHREILAIFNSHKPLPRGYALQEKDPWCAGFTSAIAIACKVTDVVPVECSCSKLIELAKKMGCWQEADNYVPKPADLVLYDFDDNGKGDNTGDPEHVGYAKVVTGGTIYVIEGNYRNAVGIRKVPVNGKNIRGFITPDYASRASAASSEVKASEPAYRKDEKLQGTYKVTANSGLNIRNGAGTKPNATGKDKSVLVAIPKGTKVTCWGYYTDVGGVKWLLVQFTYSGTTYTGFACEKHLKKV